MIIRWKEWQRALKRANKWDSPSLDDPSDADIRALKKMFRSARQDFPDEGNRIWKNIRPDLHALGGAPRDPVNIWAALAAAGPRFAFGAACAFLIMAFTFLSQSTAPPPPQVLALHAHAKLPETSIRLQEEQMVDAIQSKNGDELLRFIAYTSPAR